VGKGDNLFIVRSEAESGSLSADANVDLQCKADAIGCILLLDVDTLTGSSPTLDIKVQGLIPPVLPKGLRSMQTFRVAHFRS